ncbi:hypothetical protein MP228_005551 [Amoeboaphelidium protococcarum]|nr:hypothetical protein MP228_005551 [Amoeboaphelidium protococcarum]
MEQFWDFKFGELLEQGQQCIDQCLNVLQSRESSQRYGVEQQIQQQQEQQLEKVIEENFVILSHDEAIRGFITFMGDTITGGGLTIKLDHHSLHGHHHHIGTSKPKVIQLTFAPLNSNSNSRQASSNGSVDDADTMNHYNNKQSSSLDNLNQSRGWQVDQISDCISLLQLLDRKLKYQNFCYNQCQQYTKGHRWNVQQRMQMLEELLDFTTIILQTAQSGKEHVVKTHGLRYSSAKQFYSRVLQNSESLPLKSMIIDFYIDDGRLMLSVKHIEAVQNSHPPSQQSVSQRKQRQSSITESGVGGSSSSLSSQFQDALHIRGSSSHSNLSSYAESTAMHKQDQQDRNGHQVPQKQQQVSAKNGHSSHHLNPLDSLRSALQHHNQPSQTQQYQQQKSSNKNDGSNLEKAKSQSQPKSFFARLSSNYLGVPQPQHHQNSIAIHGGRQQSSGGSHVKQSSDEGKRSASAIPFGSHQLNHHQQQQQLNKTPSGNNLKSGSSGGTNTPIDLASVKNGQNKSQTSSQTHLAPNIEPAAAVKRDRGSSSSTKSALVQMFAPFQHIIAPVKQPRQIFNYDGQKVQLLHEDTVECKCSEEKSNYQCVIECIEDLQMSYRDLLKSLVQYHNMQQHIELNHSQKESV